MKKLLLVIFCVGFSSLATAQTKTYTNSKPVPYTGNTKTYPNYVAPKDPNTTKCTPVVVTEYNIFTKQPQQVVKCY